MARLIGIAAVLCFALSAEAQLVIAHRGASGSLPEHTLAAYRLAIEQGADYIEADLVMTKDGVLVARHENEMSATTDVAARSEFAARRTTRTIDGKPVNGWFTEDFTLREIKTLRAKERIPELRPHNALHDGKYEVPTFEELLLLLSAENRERKTQEQKPIGVYPETKHPAYFESIGLPLEEPLVALLDQPFYIDLFRRVMIFAIAALSLNLILGYGGMMSFGHAAYLGVGAYAVGVLAHHGIDNGYLQWALAIAASALVALVIGAVSVRTSGIYFIMITLAFTQMLYYLGISVEEYGGDDGMRLAVKSQFPGFIDLDDAQSFYYLVLAILVLFLYLGHRLVNSRFGMVIRAARSNDARTRAIGFSPYAYRLAAFVIAGAMCGLAGALLVNHTAFLTPEFMNWTRSGELMFMVILGGMATTAGPVLGAFALLLVEDALSGWTEHWQVILGPLLVLSVLFFKRGLAGLFPGKNE